GCCTNPTTRKKTFAPSTATPPLPAARATSLPAVGSAASPGFERGVVEFTGAMRQRQVGGFAVLGAVGVAAALGWIRCPLAALYHIPCPGCGMTRAMVLLV